MDEDQAGVADPARLSAEVERLRAMVARLEARVATLDGLAHQDSLIAIPNRRGFMRELDRLIARVQRYEGTAAMLFVDLDGLKMINDSFGHRAGDEALIEVAGLLAKGIRRSDVVARIGGDEFGILLERADESSAEETAARLTNLIGDCEFSHDGDALPLRVAIGIAMIEAGDTAEQVMARADAEMYRRKAA
jgi:diguanylate cyclase (GGDEF)-like protein